MSWKNNSQYFMFILHRIRILFLIKFRLNTSSENVTIQYFAYLKTTSFYPRLGSHNCYIHVSSNKQPARLII